MTKKWLKVASLASGLSLLATQVAWATDYTASSVFSVQVYESSSFSGPGNWTPAAAAPGSTYGATTTGNVAWKTNASAFELKVVKGAALANASTDTLSDHGGTIAAPTALTSGEAFGFSLSGVGGFAIEAKWNNSNNYAAIPNSAAGSTVYSSNVADTTGSSWAVYWKAISLTTTEAGTYTATATWTFSTTPT